ncbi:MAG: cytochrome c3 family protein [Nitrospirae bacterium]|nr:cytochrome c3 family protein [Nitrospirota bacterium]
MNKYLGVFTVTVFLLLVAAGSRVSGNMYRNPDSAKECAICHYRWIDTFYLYHKGSDLVEYESDKVESKPEMCFSCHDGSVVDSRAKVYNDHRHKINTRPPSYMKIPEIFPLDEEGKMQCSTCHSAHGVSSEMGIEKTIFLRTSNKNSAMCVMCHYDKDGGSEHGNHPIGVQKNFVIPGNLQNFGSKTGYEKNQIICETCHIVHGSPNESFLIESSSNSGLCLECHKDKNIFADDGRRKPFHVVNARFEKIKIPDELINKGAKLGPNHEIICQTCHKVHNNAIEKKLLLIVKDEASSLCLTCHTDKKYLEQTKHNLANSAPSEKNLDGKTVSEAGICSSCHLPHKTARKLDDINDFTTSLCLSCHSINNIAESVIPNDYRHPVNVSPFEKKKTDSGIILTTTSVEKEKLDLPLFNTYGAQDKNGEVTCATCHDPHRWRADSEEGEIRKEVKGDMKTSFLRKPSPEICGSCHSQKFSIKNSKHDMGKVAPKEKNILGQTPGESGLCGICHLVHGGQKNYLWARPVEIKSGVVVQDLCVNCHNDNGLAKKKVVKNYSHPVNIIPSERRIDTVLPLFDVSGKVSQNGFMTCQTCHDPHRWDPDEIIIEDHSTVEGDSKNSFLRLDNSYSSRLCVNCHQRQGLILGTDHDLNITAPDEKNVIGDTPAESGACSACHIVHNGPSSLKLWARPSFSDHSDKSVIDSLCSDCHSKGRSSENKIPPVAYHPNDMLVDNIFRSDKYSLDFAPLFDEKTGNYVNVGNISCPTCHNAHQWSPVLKEKGMNKNNEGDVTNSFLRNVSYNNICIDCHGFDAIFRYKYYHDPDDRVERIKK